MKSAKATHNSGAESVHKVSPMAKNDKGHANVGGEHGSTNAHVKKMLKDASSMNSQGGPQGHS